MEGLSMAQSTTNEACTTETALAVRRQRFPTPKVESRAVITFDRQSDRECATVMDLQRWMDLSG